MAKTKHNPEASKFIDEYISEAKPFAQAICKKLRRIIKKSDKEIIEDWKWGPNYYKEGMICGYGAFKDHVTFVFFFGAAMKDPKKFFYFGEGSMHRRSIKFTDVKQLDEKIITEYIKEAVSNNVKGIKPVKKAFEYPEDFLKALKKAKVYDKFNKFPFTHKKEWLVYIIEAKKQGTREWRITKAVERLLEE